MIRMTENDDITVLRCDASDLPTLIDQYDQQEPAKSWVNTMKESLAEMGGSYQHFGGVRTIDDAKAIVEQGWLDGSVRARREINLAEFTTLAPQSVDRRRKRRIGDEGDELRLDAALAGEWDTAWERREKQYVASPNVVSLGCAFGGGSAVDHNMMFWNGAQMMVLAHLMESAGWRVELRALKVNDMHDNGYHVQDWLVKRADQPARDDLILALFGHAGVYRVYGWAGNCFRSRKVPSTGGSVSPANLVPVTQQAVDAGLIPPFSLLIPQSKSRAEAIENIRKALQHFGQHATAA